MAIRIRLPKNQTDSISDGQPDSMSRVKYEMSTYIATIMSSKRNISPVININLIGLAENDVIPSIDNDNILLRGYFDSPASLSWRSYLTIEERKPICGTIPRRNRFDSL